MRQVSPQVRGSLAWTSRSIRPTAYRFTTMNQWPTGDPARFGHPPHRPNPWPAPPPPQTYGPVVRTHVIADEGMAKRIQRESGRGSLLATVIPIWLSQAIGLGAMWFGMTDERKVTLVLTAAFALITVISILMMTVWTPYMIRWYYGAGIPLSAEFGPDHIAFTSGTHTQVVRLTQIGRDHLGPQCDPHQGARRVRRAHPHPEGARADEHRRVVRRALRQSGVPALGVTGSVPTAEGHPREAPSADTRMAPRRRRSAGGVPGTLSVRAGLGTRTTTTAAEHP